MLFTVSRKLTAREIIDMSNEGWKEIIEELKSGLKAKMDSFGIKQDEYEIVLYDRLNEERLVYARAERRRK